MEVNKKNFQDNLPLILEAINKCDFYVIDGEFSGIGINLNNRFHLYESVEERYQKIRFVCQNYIAWQIGLATFRYLTAENCYQCQAFTFSLFPRDTYLSQRNYLFSTSTLKFLSRNNFNFKDVIEGGIAFHHLSKQKRLLEDVESIVGRGNPPSICKSSLGVRTQKEIVIILEQIKDWLEKEEESVCMGFSSSLVRMVFMKIDLKKKLGVDGIEKQKFGELAVRLTKTRKLKSHLKSQLRTEKEQKLGENSPIKKKVVSEKLLREEFEAEMGFSRVVEGLIKSRKPLIGHNLIYDITFLYSMFIDDLPESYTMFKERFHDCFPVVYDTKVFGHSYWALGQQTDLNSLYLKTKELLNCSIGICFPPEFRNLERVKEDHSAGYDAYITGKLFISLAKLINQKKLRNPKLYIPNEEEMSKENKVRKEEKTFQKESKPEEQVKPLKKVEKVKPSPSDAVSKLNELLVNFKHGPNVVLKDKP